VIPCGVNLDLFRPAERAAARERLGLAPDADIVLYVGRFAPVKGLDRLIVSVRQLRDRFSRLKLLIIGGDGSQAPNTQSLRGLVDRLEMNTAVRFEGRIEQPDLPLYYNAADLLAVPSHYESFGLVVLEALACGVPVAATPVGMVEAILQEGVNGAVAVSPEPDALGVAIARILDQSHEGGWSPRGIRTSAEAYGWPRVAAAVTDIYADLLAVHDPAQSPPDFAPCIGLPN